MARHREWRPEWSLHSVMAVPTRRPPASRTAAAPKESEVERLTVPLHTDMGPGRRVGRGGWTDLQLAQAWRKPDNVACVNVHRHCFNRPKPQHGMRTCTLGPEEHRSIPRAAMPPSPALAQVQPQRPVHLCTVWSTCRAPGCTGGLPAAIPCHIRVVPCCAMPCCSCHGHAVLCRGCHAVALVPAWEGCPHP